MRLVKHLRWAPRTPRAPRPYSNQPTHNRRSSLLGLAHLPQRVGARAAVRARRAHEDDAGARRRLGLAVGGRGRL